MSPRKLFEFENLQKFSQNTFLIYRENGIYEKIFKYKELLNVVAHLQKEFNSNSVNSPCCFAVDLNEHSFESIALLVGILDYGCHFCPVPKETTNNFLESCAASFLVSDNISNVKDFQSIKFLNKIAIYKKKFSLYVVLNSETNGKHSQLLENICYTTSTTGTTGNPKMVHVPYNCISPNINALCQKFELSSRDVVYIGTPFTFDPFFVEFFMAIATGAALLMTPSQNRLNTKNLLQILWPEDQSHAAVTVVQMTPTNFRQFGVNDIKYKILALESKLRILILGGEEFPRRHELMKWLPEKLRTDVRIFNIYGITELSCWSTIYEFDSNDDEERVPIGLPIEDFTFLRIVSTDDGQEISNCGKGELFVGSATRKAYIPQIDDIEDIKNSVNILYRSTGDLVERTSNGEIFYIARLNNVVKRMGKRICLTGIEQNLERALSKFQNVRVVFLWHESKQNLICCLKVDNEKIVSEMKAMFAENLAEHEKPDRICIVKELPLDNHNKLDRRKLLQKVLNDSVSVEPVERFECFLTDILQFDIKGVSTAKATKNKRIRLELEKSNNSIKSFLTAGGTSFQALSLATEIGVGLANSNDQRTLLKMLLDANTSIFQVHSFLKNVVIKDDNSVFDDARKSPTLTLNTTSKVELTQRKLKMIWGVCMEKCIDAAPTLSHNFQNVCIGSHAGLLLNVEASSGAVLSRFRLRDRVECQVAFASTELALVGCDAGYLYALNFLDGQIKWSLHIGSKVKAKPLVIDATFAIIGCYDGEFNLAGVCIQEQQIKWRKKIGTRPIFAAPIMLSSRKALICALDGTYECINVETSQTIWSKTCESPIFSTPTTIANKKAFIIAEVEGNVHLCHSETGQILQSFQCNGNIFSNIQAFRDKALILHIVFGCHDSHVYCLECAEKEPTGSSKFTHLTQKWKTKLNAAIFSTPNVIDVSNEVFIIACSTKGLLVVLENSTGCIVSKHNMENEVFSSICCVKNAENEIDIFFGCRDNYFYCFKY